MESHAALEIFLCIVSLWYSYLEIMILSFKVKGLGTDIDKRFVFHLDINFWK